MLGDWCIDSLAERVPGPDWDWWTGKDKQTGAAAHEIGHTIGLPHPDALNPDTGANDYPYTLMGAWWDWPNHPFHPADPDWPLRGLHAWADNTGPSGAGAHPDYQDEFLLTYHLAWFHNSVADSDEDGLPDSWEVQYFGDLSHVAATDEEPDGLINVDEVSYATHPLLADTDGDTLSDGDEIFVHGSDPTMMDTDSDGLDDADEVMLGTDPALADSDADGLPDGWEVANSLDPLANDADDDPDQDGYTNAEEFGGGTHPQLPWSIPAVPGFALAFDGADDHADFGNVVVSGATLTVEAWVMPQQSGSARVLEKLEDFGVQFTAGNVVRFLTRHGFTWHVLDGQSQNPTGEWMHIACVLDGTMKRIYVNGELDASAAYTFDVKITSNPLIIGASSPLADQGFFAGMIDEIRVWNIPRTQTQITEGMNAATPPATLGLVGYWPLDEGAGQFPMDLAGSHSGRLGTTSTEDASDPLWTASGVAPGLGPTVDSLLTPSHVPVGSMLTVTVDLSDAATGDDGVDSARLCYDYDWPFNANSVAGTGPGGNGDGTWSFTIPARSPDDAGNTLYFFIQATDHAGHSTFALDGDAPYAVLISRSGDQDADGDVDAVDYASFVGCLNGPGSPAPGCASFDFDANGAIDLADYAGFQRVLDLP
jgi:hypothetical protein